MSKSPGLIHIATQTGPIFFSSHDANVAEHFPRFLADRAPRLSFLPLSHRIADLL